MAWYLVKHRDNFTFTLLSFPNTCSSITTLHYDLTTTQITQMFRLTIHTQTTGYKVESVLVS